MIKQLLVLSALASLACCLQTAEAIEIRHLELNGAHLVDTAQGNYAVSTPTLAQKNWKAVSVNGNNVVIYAPNCQTQTRNLQSLDQSERLAIEEARSSLNAIDNGNFRMQNGRMSSSKFSMDGSRSSTSSGNIAQSSFNHDGFSINRQDDNNFSASKRGLPNNIARVFVMNDLVAFVSMDGQVQMKPMTCLLQDEQQLIQQLKLEAHQAEQQFQQQMQNFHRNMQNMQQNMHQNMQNMHQNMQNIFGNGFPFNHGMNNFMSQYNSNGMANSNPIYGQQQQQQFLPQNEYYNSMPSNGMYQNQMGASAMNMLHHAPVMHQSQNSGNNLPLGLNNNPFPACFPFC